MSSFSTFSIQSISLAPCSLALAILYLCVPDFIHGANIEKALTIPPISEIMDSKTPFLAILSQTVDIQSKNNISNLRNLSISGELGSSLRSDNLEIIDIAFTWKRPDVIAYRMLLQSRQTSSFFLAVHNNGILNTFINDKYSFRSVLELKSINTSSIPLEKKILAVQMASFREEESINVIARRMLTAMMEAIILYPSHLYKRMGVQDIPEMVFNLTRMGLDALDEMQYMSMATSQAADTATTDFQDRYESVGMDEQCNGYDELFKTLESIRFQILCSAFKDYANEFLDFTYHFSILRLLSYQIEGRCIYYRTQGAKVDERTLVIARRSEQIENIEFGFFCHFLAVLRTGNMGLYFQELVQFNTETQTFAVLLKRSNMLELHEGQITREIRENNRVFLEFQAWTAPGYGRTFFVLHLHNPWQVTCFHGERAWVISNAMEAIDRVMFYAYDSGGNGRTNKGLLVDEKDEVFTSRIETFYVGGIVPFFGSVQFFIVQDVQTDTLRFSLFRQKHVQGALIGSFAVCLSWRKDYVLIVVATYEITQQIFVFRDSSSVKFENENLTVDFEFYVHRDHVLARYSASEIMANFRTTQAGMAIRIMHPSDRRWFPMCITFDRKSNTLIDVRCITRIEQIFHWLPDRTIRYGADWNVCLTYVLGSTRYMEMRECQDDINQQFWMLRGNKLANAHRKHCLAATPKNDEPFGFHSCAFQGFDMVITPAIHAWFHLQLESDSDKMCAFVDWYKHFDRPPIARTVDCHNPERDERFAIFPDHTVRNEPIWCLTYQYTLSDTNALLYSQQCSGKIDCEWVFSGLKLIPRRDLKACIEYQSVTRSFEVKSCAEGPDRNQFLKLKFQSFQYY